MRYVVLYFFFLLMSCGTNEPQSNEETPFTFNGTWRYYQKVYRFEEPPLTQVSEGMECSRDTRFTFAGDEFEIIIAAGPSCQNSFYYVLAFEMDQVNDSTYTLTSIRLIRSNYKPIGEPDFSDIPLIDDQVKLIVRSSDEFITYLNLPEEPIFEGRPYSSSYIRYQRIEN